MSLVSGISALAARIASEFNTLRGAIGPDEDYSAYLGTALGPAPASVGTASETQAGLTQLATAADVAAGTNAAKAVSAFQLAALLGAQPKVFAVANFAALNTAVLTAPEGSVFVVGRFSIGGTQANLIHRSSVWVKSNGQGIPATDIIVGGTTDSTGVPQALLNAGDVSSALVTQTNLALYAYDSVVYTNNTKMIWDGSAWKLWSRQLTSWTPGTTGWTQGNGSVNGFYWIENGVWHCKATIVFGSTSALGTGNLIVTAVPFSSNGINATAGVTGSATIRDDSVTGYLPCGFAANNSAQGTIRPIPFVAPGTQAPTGLSTSTSPITFAVNDHIDLEWTMVTT